MQTSELQIETSKTIPEVEAQLNALADKKLKSNPKLILSGHASGGIINFETYNNPPVRIKGDMKSNNGITIINLIFSQSTYGRAYRLFIYALMYPLLFVFTVIDVENRADDFWVLIYFPLAVIGIWFFGKLTSFSLFQPTIKYVVEDLHNELSTKHNNA